MGFLYKAVCLIVAGVLTAVATPETAMALELSDRDLEVSGETSFNRAIGMVILNFTMFAEGEPAECEMLDFAFEIRIDVTHGCSTKSGKVVVGARRQSVTHPVTIDFTRELCTGPNARVLSLLGFGFEEPPPDFACPAGLVPDITRATAMLAVTSGDVTASFPEPVELTLL